MSTGKLIHLAVRYSDKFMSVSSTIEKHNELITRRGAVWFGKVGKPLAQRRIDQFHKQIEQGNKTYLYLIQKSKNIYEVYQCDVVQMARSVPEHEEDLVPDYYANGSM